MQCALEQKRQRAAMMNGGRFTGRMSNGRALRRVHEAYTRPSAGQKMNRRKTTAECHKFCTDFLRSLLTEMFQFFKLFSVADRVAFASLHGSSHVLLVLTILLIFFYFLFATTNIFISYCYCFAGPCLAFIFLLLLVCSRVSCCLCNKS